MHYLFKEAKRYVTLEILTELPEEKRKAVATWAYRVMYFAFMAHIALFSFGKAFREAGPIIGLVGLIVYYRLDYKDSTLARFPFKWAFAVLYGYMALNTIFSGWFMHSFAYLKPNIWKGLVIPFLAMECIRTRKDIIRAVLCFAVTAVGQGMNGMWQYYTGADLVTNRPLMSGRLTGSFGTYRVGSYISMALVPALALWWLLPRSLNMYIRAALVPVMLFPAFFLFIFAQMRSGWLGLFLALYGLLVVLSDIDWKKLIAPPVLFALLVLFGPDRISLATALKDGRWELWSAGWEIFLNNMWFGAGLSTFKPASFELGSTFIINKDGMPHPHGIFVQFLSDGGIVGFALFSSFLLGLLAWGGWSIRKQFHSAARSSSVERYSFWGMAAFFWAAYLCCLGTGLFGENFYRTWWLTMLLQMLGCMIGAVVNADAEDRQDRWRELPCNGSHRG